MAALRPRALVRKDDAVLIVRLPVSEVRNQMDCWEEALLFWGLSSDEIPEVELLRDAYARAMLRGVELPERQSRILRRRARKTGARP